MHGTIPTANGDDVEGIPAWLRAAVLLGVPSVIALFLVYWLTMLVDMRLLTMTDKIDAHIRETQRMNAFLYALCLNEATSDLQSARCAVALGDGLSDKGLR